MQALGFISPPRPDVLAPSNVVIDGVIVGDDASHADEPAKKRQRVHVYKVQMEDKEAAVAKIPDSHFRYDIEVPNALLCPSRKRPREVCFVGCSRYMSPFVIACSLPSFQDHCIAKLWQFILRII